MSINNTIKNKPTTRIIPGLRATYEIVSMPYWAWFWLEDFMRSHRVNYQGIYDTFGGRDGWNLQETLQDLAELHQEYALREQHNLSNDNEFNTEGVIEKLRTSAPRKKVKMRALNLPKIYKLFGFMSCATTLEAVWRRQNYEDSNKIN